MCDQGYCWHKPTHPKCPGWTREEVTIDYEAAARVRWYGRHTDDWASLSKKDQLMWITATKAIVNTALGE